MFAFNVSYFSYSIMPYFFFSNFLQSKVFLNVFSHYNFLFYFFKRYFIENGRKAFFVLRHRIIFKNIKTRYSILTDQFFWYLSVSPPPLFRQRNFLSPFFHRRFSKSLIPKWHYSLCILSFIIRKCVQRLDISMYSVHASLIFLYNIMFIRKLLCLQTIIFDRMKSELL